MNKRHRQTASATKKQQTESSDSGSEAQGTVIDPEDGLFQAFQELEKKLGPKGFIELLLLEIPPKAKGK
jgi:hypothetical protein